MGRVHESTIFFTLLGGKANDVYTEAEDETVLEFKREPEGQQPYKGTRRRGGKRKLFNPTLLSSAREEQGMVMVGSFLTSPSTPSPSFSEILMKPPYTPSNRQPSLPLPKHRSDNFPWKEKFVSGRGRRQRTMAADMKRAIRECKSMLLVVSDFILFVTCLSVFTCRTESFPGNF